MTTRKRPPHVIRHKDLGPLHDLLIAATVPDSTGKKSITVLAKSIDFTPWALYLWIKNNRVPGNMARYIVDQHAKYAEKVNLAKADRVTFRDFDPYVYQRVPSPSKRPKPKAAKRKNAKRKNAKR